MSGLGQKQTFAAQKVMSALPPKADILKWVQEKAPCCDARQVENQKSEIFIKGKAARVGANPGRFRRRLKGEGESRPAPRHSGNFLPCRLSLRQPRTALSFVCIIVRPPSERTITS